MASVNGQRQQCRGPMRSAEPNTPNASDLAQKVADSCPPTLQNRDTGSRHFLTSHFACGSLWPVFLTRRIRIEIRKEENTWKGRSFTGAIGWESRV